MGSGQSDDPTYYGGEFDEVIIGPGNDGSSGGDSGGGGGFDWGYGSGTDGYQGGGDNYGGGGGSTDLPSESEM